MIITIRRNQLKEVLMEPRARGVKEVFSYIQPDEGEINLMVLYPGKNGSEFNKTLGFFHNFPGVLIYRCLYGQGIMLIQKNDDGGAKEFRVVALRSGVEVEIPSGYGHCIVNTGKSILVTADNAPRDNKYKDTQTVKEKHGLAYYVIDKKGEVSFEINSNYQFHPQITTY